MKKDIAFLIPSMNGGGAEKVTMLLVNELSCRGWRVTLLLSKLEGPYLKRIHDSVLIKELKNESISKNIVEIARYLRSEKPSIFYSSMMYVNVIAGIASSISRYSGTLFFSEHTHASNNIRNNKGFTSTLTMFLAKLIYKRADVIVCVSKEIKKDLLVHMKNLKSIVVINNPVENYSSISTHSDDSDLKYRIISMGRLDKNKNFQLLIRAFAKVIREKVIQKDIELYILGEGNERAKLETLIKDLKVQGKVFLPGFVENPSDILNNANLFVLTSKVEGFGNVLVEALSCGLPVISTDCPTGPGEILKNGRIGKIVPVDDIDSLRDAIVSEILYPNRTSTREERIERAQDYSIEKIVGQYEALLLKESERRLSTSTHNLLW